MRVASLLPSATETPFALGIEPVGVSHGCDQPPATRSLPTLTSTVVDHEDRTAGDVDAQMRSVEGVVYDLAVDRLRKRAADAAAGGRPRTAVLDWTDPPIRAGHRVRDMVDIAGGDPSFQPVGASEPVAWADVCAYDPEVLVVDGNALVNRPSHRLVASLEAVFGCLYPDHAATTDAGRRVERVDGRRSVDAL